MNDVDNLARGDIHGAVGSYVVHALEEPELSDFEAHLDGCERCSNEVREFGETLAEMSAGFAADPPASVRTSILGAIGGVAQLPAETGSGVDRESEHERRSTTPWTPRHAAEEVGAVRPTTAESATGAVPGEAAPLAPVASLADARRRRASRALIAVAAAVALIAVAAGGWAINLNQRLQNQQAGLSVSQQQSQRETSLLRAPDAKIYTTKLKDGDPVSYVVSKAENAAMLVGGNVPSPGAGKVYQLWTVQNVTSKDAIYGRDATFGTGDQQRVFLTTDVAKADALGISIEPVGSQPSKPTTKAFALVTL